MLPLQVLNVLVQKNVSCCHQTGSRSLEKSSAHYVSCTRALLNKLFLLHHEISVFFLEAWWHHTALWNSSNCKEEKKKKKTLSNGEVSAGPKKLKWCNFGSQGVPIISTQTGTRVPRDQREKRPTNPQMHIPSSKSVPYSTRNHLLEALSWWRHTHFFY